MISIIDHDPIVDQELARLAPVVGADLPAYRNHIYRVLTYAMHFLSGAERWRPTLAFALVYHDVGMWTDKDLAYLEPSEARAETARAARAPSLDGALVANIIHWHHKVTAFTGPHAAVVDAARKGDWIDVSEGRLRQGVSREDVAAVSGAIPRLGFTDTLMRLAGDLNHGHTVGGVLRVLTHVYKW